MTWTSRTLKAEWAARAWHTTVVDAAGAIYIIGGDQGDSADVSGNIKAALRARFGNAGGAGKRRR
jgi:hypothetical protein